MFSQACVKNSVHMGDVCGSGGMPGVCGDLGACVGCVCGNWCVRHGDMHGRGCAKQGGMHGRGCMEGGRVWQRGACVAGETAIAAGSTYPTGMHSCFVVTDFSEFSKNT